MRCFVAIELDDAWRGALARVWAESSAVDARDVKWVDREQLHITLKFLGELADAQVAQAAEAVAQAAAQIDPFTLRLGALGVFSSRGLPRVLWAAAEDPARRCARWLAAADPFFATMGVPAERRAITPHVTLARSKSAAGGRVLEAVARSAVALPALDLNVTQITLFQSELSPRGSRYTTLHRARLSSRHA